MIGQGRPTTFARRSRALPAEAVAVWCCAACCAVCLLVAARGARTRPCSCGSPGVAAPSACGAVRFAVGTERSPISSRWASRPTSPVRSGSNRRDRNPPAQPTRLRRRRRAHRGRSRRSIDRDAHERSRRTGQAGGDRSAKLVGQPHASPLDEVGNRLMCRAPPGDRLRVDFDREHLVFSPGESFSSRSSRTCSTPSAAGIRYQTKMLTMPGGSQVWCRGVCNGRGRDGDFDHDRGARGRRRVRPVDRGGAVVAIGGSCG